MRTHQLITLFVLTVCLPIVVYASDNTMLFFMAGGSYAMIAYTISFIIWIIFTPKDKRDRLAYIAFWVLPVWAIVFCIPVLPPFESALRHDAVFWYALLPTLLIVFTSIATCVRVWRRSKRKKI